MHFYHTALTLYDNKMETKNELIRRQKMNYTKHSVEKVCMQNDKHQQKKKKSYNPYLRPNCNYQFIFKLYFQQPIFFYLRTYF